MTEIEASKSQALEGEQRRGSLGASDNVAGWIVDRPARRKLPDERVSITHKFSIGGHEGYITVGMYEDGYPGEIFITMARRDQRFRG
jgi:hypothetical protein